MKIKAKFNCRNVIFLEGTVRNLNVSTEGKLYFIIESLSTDKQGVVYKCPVKCIVPGKSAVALLSKTLWDGKLIEVEGVLRWSEQSDTYKIVVTHAEGSEAIIREVDLNIEEVK